MIIEQTPLIDVNPFQYTLLEEAEHNGVKKIRLRGPLSEGGVKNRNNRIYPMTLLERELNRVMPDIRARKLIGELDHPDDLKIHLDKVSHLVIEAAVNNGKIVGTIEVIDGTPCGQILRGLIDAGVQLGISSRAMGSVQKNNEGIDIVQEDFTLLTWDVVAQPSFYNSWLTLAESRRLGLVNVETSNFEELLDQNLNNKSKLFFG